MPKNAELVAAYQILGGIPDEQIDLGNIITEPGRTVGGRPFCGTVACGVGWLLMHPRYIERGFGVRRGKWHTEFKTPHWSEWHDELYTSVASKMFDIDEDTAFELFCHTALNSKYNPATCVVMTDKQLLLARIRNYLRS